MALSPSKEVFHVVVGFHLILYYSGIYGQLISVLYIHLSNLWGCVHKKIKGGAILLRFQAQTGKKRFAVISMLQNHLKQ